MKEEKVKITNELGLHARPSAVFVKKSSGFISEITVCKDGMEVNGKSIMSLMMLAAEPQSEIVIRAEGEDEEKAIQTLIKLVEGGFKE
jgi:phosphocarrier protein HPr